MPVLFIANKTMKKILSIIIGLVVGPTLGLALAMSDREQKAFALNPWTEIVAAAESHSWKDVFGTINPGKDLYELVYYKRLIDADKQALRAVAGNFGMTSVEMNSVLSGSLDAIYNTTRRRDTELTREEAVQVYENAVEDYTDLKELYDIQQQIDLAVAPSEIFANGDLSDSGFDLIHDLNVIEEILFVDKGAITVGTPFNESLDEPYLPTDPDFAQESFVAANDPRRESSEGFSRSGDSAGSNAGSIAVSSDELVVDAQTITEDVCETDDQVGSALDSFEATQPVEVADGTVASDSLADAGSGTPNDEVTDSSAIKPATPGQWGGGAWCPGLGSLDSSGNLTGYGGSFFHAGWDSLDEAAASLINNAFAAVAGYEGPGISAQFAFCVDTKLVFKRVRSYTPGQSCIACEVDEINDYMNKALSYSLIPNKVTGNYMESAKCKASLGIPAVDMDFILIPAPITTPPNDELIFGSNIFEQWNKFVKQYHPFFGWEPTFSEELHTDMLLDAVGGDAVQADIVNQVRALRAQQTAAADDNIVAVKLGNTGSGVMQYSQEVLTEMRQMTAFFQSFNNQFSQINNQVCPAIVSKPDIQ